MRTATRIVGGLIAAVLLVVAGAYLVFDREHASLDVAARAGASGKFARLSEGVTHYDLAGENGRQTVVLLSGATVPYYIWDSTAAALSGHGFRVLRYDYYGRGYSDRPALAYDLAMYDRQLTELLDTLGIRGPVDVAGVSMGGAIAVNFADRHPDRVLTVILVDPAIGVSHDTPLPLRSAFTGDLALTFGASSMAKGQLDDFVHPERYPDWVSRYEPQMRYRGFRRSIFETQRHDVFKRPARSFETLARSQTPMLVIWGKEDHTVPIMFSDTVRAAFPRAEFHVIDGAGHLPHIEQAAVVDSILLDFLARTVIEEPRLPAGKGAGQAGAQTP
ncbi:MAG TPA: alpha/beta fold hydrolase [Gemmatimonadaceae bacterium]|nr:alpha/beta fold hydrolase [Gemmatimonadaceae bacterium]